MLWIWTYYSAHILLFVYYISIRMHCETFFFFQYLLQVKFGSKWWQNFIFLGTILSRGEIMCKLNYLFLKCKLCTWAKSIKAALDCRGSQRQILNDELRCYWEIMYFWAKTQFRNSSFRQPTLEMTFHSRCQIHFSLRLDSLPPL